jgi:hypothetical protein
MQWLEKVLAAISFTGQESERQVATPTYKAILSLSIFLMITMDQQLVERVYVQ